MTKAFLITPHGKQRLQDERDWLWRVARPQVTQSVSEAAAQGDRSENAEYIYGKRRLREIDRRLRFLNKRLAALTPIEPNPDDPSRARFGAWAWLEDDDLQVRVVRLVGSDEFDLHPLYISMDSPMARALLGKAEGDDVCVPTPKGEHLWSLVALSYLKPNGWPEQERIDLAAQGFVAEEIRL